jgi:organic radical activating enzyme
LQSQLAERIITLANRYHISLCVITGGEPLLQDFLPLTRMLNANEIYVGVETAGSVYLPGLKQLFEFDLNYIVCSPKTARLNASLIPLIRAYKYICKAGELAEDDGLPMMSTQIEGLRQRLFRPPVGARIYLQPCDENDPIKNARNQQACVEMCLKHGYRLSLQLHKICGLD